MKIELAQVADTVISLARQGFTLHSDSTEMRVFSRYENGKLQTVKICLHDAYARIYGTRQVLINISADI